jgi:branched-chain amino acid transport system substrate-binding protein
MNGKKVLQLFVFAGASEFGDPKHFPWTMGWQPTYQNEARVYAKFLLEHEPYGKIGILSQNDDLGKDYVAGLKDGLEGKMPIIAELVYETTDPTVDSQIVTLKTSGADILLNASTPKFAAQAIKKMAEIGWKPVHLLIRPSNSIGSVLKPTGLQNANGILSSGFIKDPTDPSWNDDAGVKAWSFFMDQHFPDGDRNNSYTVLGYSVAQTFVQVLRQCGDDLTRENLMRQAANLKSVELGMLLPGITVNTSPEDYYPIKQMQMMRFNGARWERFGTIIGGGIGGR